MAEATEAHLDITDMAGEVRRVTLAGGRMVIGRTEDTEITLPAPTVSRQHAEVFADPFGRWWIKDMGSRNGTHVNGNKIDEHLLAPNDQIKIEEFVLVFGAKGPLPTRSRTGPSAFNATMSVTHSESDSFARLDSLATPKIEATHVSNLTAFSSKLLNTENDDERLDVLCNLLVGKDFHGNSAMAFRLNRQDAEPQPEMLHEPVSSKNWRGDEKPYVSKTLLRGVTQQAAPVIASNVSSGGDVMALSLAGNVQQLAAIACPIQISDSSLDVLYVTFPGEFGTPEWLALAALAAEQFQQAELAWEARRKAQEQAIVERELQRASKIQNGLIPQKFNFETLEIAIGFEPCKWVGGDYVDVKEGPDGRIYISIYDVCGKGIQAALITASLHTMFQINTKSGLPLDNFMESFNEQLEATLPDESFVTACCTIYDPKTGKLQTSNAGHPPAMIVSVDGKVRELPSSENPPLGYIPVPFDCHETEIAPGELLCLYTDGLTESVNEQDDMLGIEGVNAMLEKVSPAGSADSIDEQCRNFVRMLDEYEGNALRADDRTFILVRRQA